MLKKSERTLDLYMRAGAEMRLFKEARARLVVDVSKVLSASDQDVLMRALDKVDKICSRTEENMFSDYPSLSNQYIDVFYGSISMKPRNDVDAEVIDMAKDIAAQMGAKCVWKDTREYQRVLEILSDYWEPDEERVEVEMRFLKNNGETQEKRIVWVRPQKED